MKGLRGRLVVGVLGATVVVGTLASVIFFIWQSDALRERQGLWLALQAEGLARQLVQQDESTWPDLITRHSGAVRVQFTLVGSQGENHLSGAHRWAQPLGLEPKNLEAGYHHASAQLHGQQWLVLVASLPTTDMYEQLYALSSSAFMWLIVLLVTVVTLTMVFYRRLVIYPIERLKELVGTGDATGLSQFGEAEPGDLGFLSRGIIAMNQKMADDSDELSRRLEDLTQAQGQLVRAERLAVVGQLAAGVAHEVGNPLAVVSGYVEMMAAGELEEKQQERALESMARELERMNRTIRDLLDYSRDEAGDEGNALLGAGADHVERLLRSQSRWRQIEFEVCTDSKPTEVHIASDKLVQLLLNLCLNACTAMDGRGKLKLSWEMVGSKVEIYVDDSGPGVPESRRQEIFEPFFTTRKAGEGTGLGLSVCENIVSRVGGKIWVEESPCKGARFVLCLAGKRLEDSQ